MGKRGLNFTEAEIAQSARKPGDPDAALSAVDKVAWWVRTLCNIYAKLYQGHFADFCRDHRRLIESLYQFRLRCRGRGWTIPDADLERLLGKLVARCQEAITKGAMERVYVPGYLGKAVARFVDEVADQAQRRWKQQANLSTMPPEILKAIVDAAAARTLNEKVES